LILAGAVSNVGERTIFGFVRDWVYIYTGVFNLADGYIILGIIILFFYSLMTKTTEMTKLT
jgi:lipoprotein signal peptidase